MCKYCGRWREYNYCGDCGCETSKPQPDRYTLGETIEFVQKLEYRYPFEACSPGRAAIEHYLRELQKLKEGHGPHWRDIDACIGFVVDQEKACSHVSPYEHKMYESIKRHLWELIQFVQRER